MAARAAETVTQQAFREVLHRVNQATARAGRPPHSVRLVAVSQAKAPSRIREVYDLGHRQFGEKFAQELLDKAQALPEDIQWHYVGTPVNQKLKAMLSGVPNLYMVEGVDSPRVANMLNWAVGAVGRHPLKVLVQVNTSGVRARSGVSPSESVWLARHVRTQCPNLEFAGLMTLGMPEYNDSYTATPESLQMLINCREAVCQALRMPREYCELSMGMSADFEHAISMGSTGVRVGFSIFGSREYPPLPAKFLQYFQQ